MMTDPMCEDCEYNDRDYGCMLLDDCEYYREKQAEIKYDEWRDSDERLR